MLESFHPIIFLSVHPKILIQRGQSTKELISLLKKFNYKIFKKKNSKINELLSDEYICK